MTETKKAINLWSDTFTIEISVIGSPQHHPDVFKESIRFTGSLKGAIRYVINDYRKTIKGNITVVFLSSKGDYIKEIGM